jgi:hypothetical protein
LKFINKYERKLYDKKNKWICEKVSTLTNKSYRKSDSVGCVEDLAVINRSDLLAHSFKCLL